MKDLESERKKNNFFFEKKSQEKKKIKTSFQDNLSSKL